MGKIWVNLFVSRFFRLLLSFSVIFSSFFYQPLLASQTIESVVPSGFDVVEKGLFSSSKRFVYIIEDLHFDPRCQFKIANAVRYLLKNNRIDAIALEGTGFGLVHPGYFDLYKRWFGKKYFGLLSTWLKRGFLSVGEYICLCFGDQVPIYGLENKKLYEAHLRDFYYLYPLLKLKLVKLDLSAKQAYFVLKRRDNDDIYLQFYRLAIKRDYIFKRHLDKILSMPKNKRIVVVCGGFHSLALRSFLRGRSISYEVLRPRLYAISPVARLTYFTSLYSSYSLNTLALPNRIDLKSFPNSGLRLWLSIGSVLWRNAKTIFSLKGDRYTEARDVYYHFRLPSFVWAKVKDELRRNKIGQNLYYLVRGRGFAWVDSAGRMHFIDEFLHKYFPENSIQFTGWLWAVLGENFVSMYSLPRMHIEDEIKLTREIIEFHERLHSIFRRNYRRKKIFFKRLEKKLAGDKHKIQDWISEVYGKPSVLYSLKGKKLFMWYLEEFVIAILQEYVMRYRLASDKDWVESYVNFLETNGVSLPCDKTKFIDFANSVVNGFVNNFGSTLLKLGMHKDKYAVFIDDKDFYLQNTPKKFKKMVELLWKLYGKTSFPDGEKFWYHAWSLFEQVSRFYPKRQDIKAGALLHVIFNLDKDYLYKFVRKLGYQGLEDKEDIILFILNKSGFGQKESKNIVQMLQISHELYVVRFKLDETAPLASPTYLNDSLDYYIELSRANLWALRLFLNDVLLTLDSSRVLDKRESAILTLHLKYLYIALAERIGLKRLFLEMKDLLFRLEQPKDYFIVKAKLRDLVGKKTEHELLETVEEKIFSLVPELSEVAKISGRLKRVGSILEKTVRRNRELSALFDILGMKIVLPDDYKQINSLMNKLRNGLFDSKATLEFVSKGNLHYYVLQGDVDGVPLDLHIKTESVDREAETGLASHWSYNLKKIMPVIWKNQQRFRADNVDLGTREDKNLHLLYKKILIDPVVLVVEDNNGKLSGFKFYPIKSSLLRRNISDFLRRYNRVFVFRPEVFFKGYLQFSVAELDLKYKNSKEILREVKEHPYMVYMFSKENLLTYLQEKFIKYRNVIFASFFVFLYFLRPELFSSLHFLPFFIGMTALDRSFVKKIVLPIEDSDEQLYFIPETKDYYRIEKRSIIRSGVKYVLGRVRFYRLGNDFYVDDFSKISLKEMGTFLDYLMKKHAKIIFVNVSETSRISLWQEAFHKRHFYPYVQGSLLIFLKSQVNLSIWMRRLLSSVYEKVYHLVKLHRCVELRSYLGRLVSSEIVTSHGLANFLKNLLYDVSRLRGRILFDKHVSNVDKQGLINLMELVTGALQKMQERFGPCDVRNMLMNSVTKFRKHYPNKEVDLKIEGKLPSKVFTYGYIFNLALDRIVGNAFKFATSRLSIILSVDNGELILKVTDDGQGISKIIKDRLLKDALPDSMTKNETGGYGLVFLYRTLQKLGGNIKFHSVVGNGSIFELHLPAWYKGIVSKKGENVLFVYGKEPLKTQGVGRFLSTKLNFYYINLDFILYYFIYRVYENPALWKAIMSFDASGNQKKVEEILEMFFLKKFYSRLKFEQNALYIDDLNSGLFLNEVGLMDEISQLKNFEEVFDKVIEKYGTSLERFFAKKIMRASFLGPFDYTGIVFRTKFNLCDHSKCPTLNLVEDGWDDYTTNYIVNTSVELLSTAKALKYYLIFYDVSKVADYLKASKSDKELLLEVSNVLSQSFPIALKIKLLNALEIVLRRQASFLSQPEETKTLVAYLRSVMVKLKNKKVKFRLVLLLRHLSLYRLVDVVMNKIMPPVTIQLRLQMKNISSEDKDKLKAKMMVLSQCQSKISRLLKELSSTKWTWEQEPRIYAQILSELDSFLREAESIVPNLSQARELINKVKDALFMVDWIGDVAINDRYDLHNLDYSWQEDLFINVVVRVHMPALSRETFNELREEINNEVKVVFHLSRVNFVGGPWHDNREFLMRLTGFEEDHWKRNLVYSVQIPLGKLGPGLYEFNISANSPAGRVWWDTQQRHYSEVNRFGNGVIKVHLKNRESFQKAIIKKLKGKGIFIGLNEFGDGYLLDVIPTRVEKKLYRVMLEFYRLNGLNRLKNLGRAYVIWNSDGHLLYYPQDVTGIFEKIKWNDEYDSIDCLIKDLIGQIKAHKLVYEK